MVFPNITIEEWEKKNGGKKEKKIIMLLLAFVHNKKKKPTIKKISFAFIEEAALFFLAS